MSGGESCKSTFNQMRTYCVVLCCDFSVFNREAKIGIL
ncbi:hypothetical protein QN277_023113 [Acacia crassicarpa]|uniref:Uncharacterized protein n=1 Tax=Acacia crassicarpa TaxID=499986 RepID=A0AAE1MMN8_9FABA|nr:hypothetical protein QN277_023113 [Acacia crassicarpa]